MDSLWTKTFSVDRAPRSSFYVLPIPEVQAKQLHEWTVASLHLRHISHMSHRVTRQRFGLLFESKNCAHASRELTAFSWCLWILHWFFWVSSMNRHQVKKLPAFILLTQSVKGFPNIYHTTLSHAQSDSRWTCCGIQTWNQCSLWLRSNSSADTCTCSTWVCVQALCPVQTQLNTHNTGVPTRAVLCNMCNVNKNKNQGPKVQKTLSPCGKKSKLSWIGRFFFFFFFSFRKQRCTVEQSEIPKQNNKKKEKKRKENKNR